jgi:molecular chaperone DnaK (HSP70)
MVIAKWLRRLTAMRSNDWTGCIDFGTAYSKFAMVRAEETDDLGGGDIRPMAIGKGVSLNPYLLPSLIFVDQDVVLFGRLAEQAAVRAERQGRSAFVSPKQYLSTHDPVDFDSRLEPEIDPTGSYTPRQLITLYLAYLIKRAEAVAGEEKLPWPARMRIARPAWQIGRAHV